MKATFLAVFLAVSLTGCAESRNPIAPLSDATAAPELLGTWVTAPAGEQNPGCPFKAELRVRPVSTSDQKQFELMLIGSSVASPGKTSWTSSEGYVTRLPNGPFLNLLALAEGPEADLSEDEKRSFAKEKEGRYFEFVPYETQTIGATRLVKFGTGFGATLYSAGIAGKLAFDRPNSLITASSGEIARYVGSLSESDLFSSNCMFEKVE